MALVFQLRTNLPVLEELQNAWSAHIPSFSPRFCVAIKKWMTWRTPFWLDTNSESLKTANNSGISADKWDTQRQKRNEWIHTKSVELLTLNLSLCTLEGHLPYIACLGTAKKAVKLTILLYHTVVANWLGSPVFEAKVNPTTCLLK